MQLRRRDQRTLTQQLLYVEEPIALCRKHIERLQTLLQSKPKEEATLHNAQTTRGIADRLSMDILERDQLKRELDDL